MSDDSRTPSSEQLRDGRIASLSDATLTTDERRELDYLRSIYRHHKRTWHGMLTRSAGRWNTGHEIAVVVRETLVPPVQRLAAEVDNLMRPEADRE